MRPITKVMTGWLVVATSILGGCASTQETPASLQEGQPEVVERANTESNEVSSKKEVTKKASKPVPEAKAVPVAAKVQEPKAAEQKSSVKAAAPTKSADSKALVQKKQKAPEPKLTKKVKNEAKQPKVASKPSKASMKNALNVSSSDLPLKVEIWTLREGFEDEGNLILRTPTMQMGEGDYYSQISLTLEENQLIIYSSSDIDTDLSGIGVRLNGSELIPFDRIEGTNAGILEGDWMSKLSAGGSLEIMLGFFPGKETTSPVFKRVASIDALEKLVPTYYKLQ